MGQKEREREREEGERERTADTIGNRSSRSRRQVAAGYLPPSSWVSLLNVRRPIKIISDETNESQVYRTIIDTDKGSGGDR